MILLALSLAAPNARAEDAPAAPVVVHYLASEAPAVAEDEPVDEEEDEESVKSEKDAVRSSQDSSSKSSSDAGKKKGKKRVIKVIQKKNFMKIARYEVGPQIGFVTNDPFLNRYIVGLTLDYHLTEVFAIEIQGAWSPILGKEGSAASGGDADWKPLSKQLLEENSVSPDISKLQLMGSAALAFSPIYGKAAVGRSIIAFDIYGAFGLGAVQTDDDAYALQVEDDSEPVFANTNIQWHPTTVISGGARVAFGEGIAARLEGKSMSYIETINSTTLEMKNNFILQGGVTFFFPNMK